MADERRERAPETSHPSDRSPTRGPTADADEQLATTAEHWRQTGDGSPAEDSADEVARGAERAAEQPEFGREGS